MEASLSDQIALKQAEYLAASTAYQQTDLCRLNKAWSAEFRKVERLEDQILQLHLKLADRKRFEEAAWTVFKQVENQNEAAFALKQRVDALLDELMALRKQEAAQ